MLLRNRRRLLSLVLTVVLFSAVYIIAKDVRLNVISQSIIREPSQESSTVQQLGKILNLTPEDVEVQDEGKVKPKKEDEKEVKDVKKANTKKENVKEDKSGKNWESIMPSMPDLDAKQELGRASWKYFHTLLARFPDEPSDEERKKLETFVTLYAELYPCGECSYHFQKMLKKYPVQTSSRTAAAMWGCHVHNVVNDFLKKDVYDCSTILEDYDCGCGDLEEST
ncbi:FAD-linked sulfhydryl oxidase Erv2p [Monosporozyma servazzii]